MTESKEPWITKEQLNRATIKAKDIYQDFLREVGGGCEQSWDEIEIDGLYFDIECWDETEDQRRDTSCSIYPTFPTKENEYRETDGTRSICLFQNKEVCADEMVEALNPAITWSRQ